MSSIFSYNYQDGLLVDDLDELATALGDVVICGSQKDLSDFNKWVDGTNIDFVNDELKDKYLAEVNALAEGVCLTGSYEAICRQAAKLKKLLNDYVNYICDFDLNHKLKSLNEEYCSKNDILKEQDAEAKRQADELARKQALEARRLANEKAHQEYLKEKADTDRRNFGLIMDATQRIVLQDRVAGIAYIRRRQFLREEIYRNLLLDPNMKGKVICENINKKISDLGDEFADTFNFFMPAGSQDTSEDCRSFHFNPSDIYAEWSSVKDDMATGDFGKNYPDNVPKDYDAAEKFLETMGIFVVNNEPVFKPQEQSLVDSDDCELLDVIDFDYDGKD